MKKILIVCLLFGIMAFQALWILCQEGQTLAWDIQFLKGKAQGSISDFQTITVESGDELHIAISPVLDSFCYVLIQNSERKITVLHDKSIKSGNDTIIDLIRVDDSPGTKTLYVIMSMARQTKLEDLINRYKSNPRSQRYANNLHGEIAGLQETVSGLGEPVSVIIPTGGTTRGTVQEYATRFSGKNLYVRAITIHVTPAR